MTTRDSSWILITGASSGLGAEFARQYGVQGHSLVLVARRLDRLQKLAESLHRQFRIDVVVEQVDLDQQGSRGLYVGNATPAASGHFLPHHE